MKVPRLGKYAILIVMIFAGFYLVNCLPPSDAAGQMSNLENAEKARQDSLRDVKCELYLSFAYSYYQNQDWRGAISNYKKMINAGCEETRAVDIFQYYGRAYQQLATKNPIYLDSALYVYQEGEDHLPNDIFLHKNIAYIYQLQGKTDLEIREYEKMVEIEPENIDHYRRLVKLGFAAERYEDVLLYISEILRLKPNDEQAINDRITVYQKLGKDITTVQKAQWEKNPTNVRYGLEYARALAEQYSYNEAIAVYKKVTALDMRNREAWERMAEIYATMEKHNEAIEAFIYINKNIALTDVSIIEDIVRGYRRLAKWADAYEWSQKALAIEKSALTYKMRADVYFEAAEMITSGRPPSFEDKLVYKLAYDDYLQAQKMGDLGVKSRIDFLKQYLIPTNEDWFMNKYDADGAERKLFRPKMPEYSWITAEAKQN